MLAEVQLDVFDQEMLERAKRGLIPIRRLEDFAEHGLKPAVLVARQGHCPRQRILATDFGRFSCPRMWTRLRAA